MFKNCLLILWSCLCIPIYAQQNTLRGTVIDDMNEPLMGVSILIKETSEGTITDLDGNYVLSNVQPGQTLVFSYIGMKSQTFAYSGQAVLNVKLADDSELMDEVVVIGYQTVRKADLTGAVAVMDTKLLGNKTVTGSVGDALGTLPGVMVRSSGAPGKEGKVVIRGSSTFGNGDPLYVVDGVISEANRDFNFNDIETIQVLKDASAAAIYGSRAANGVVIITTKGGKEGPMKIEASTQWTAQWLPKYNFAGRERWIELNDLAFANAGRGPANHYDGNTDWQKEVFKTGLVQDHNISFSGGSSTANYYISGNMQDNSGTTIGTESRRFTLRSNTSASRDLGDLFKFRVGENIILSNYRVDELDTNPIIDVYRMLPTIGVYDPANAKDGGWGYGEIARDVTYGVNPIAKENIEETVNRNLRVRGNLFAELEFKKMLKYRFNLGFDYNNDDHRFMRREGKYRYQQPEDPSSLTKYQARAGNLVYDNTLEFNKRFGVHSISAVAGMSYQHQYYERLTGTKTDLTPKGNNDYYDQFQAGGNMLNLDGYREEEKLYSLFGRVNYNYAERYLFSFTIRRDESSKFAPGERVGYFPSVSLGWRISEESFFNVSAINDLKIRANYGSLGNSNIGYWDWMAVMNMRPQIAMGTDQVLLPGMIQTRLANSNLTWEKQTQLNVGFDLMMLSNRLQISADAYLKKGTDLLAEVFIPLSLGHSGDAPKVNGASVDNKGLDLSITWRDKVGKVGYNLNLNGTYLNNKVKKLAYGMDDIITELTYTSVGYGIGDWYLVKTDGIFRTQAEIDAYKTSKGTPIEIDGKRPELGDVRYIDYNDDGTINDSDRQYAGRAIPNFQFALNIGLDYRNFDLQAQFTSAFGHKLYNGPRETMDRFSDNSAYRKDYDPWTSTNTGAKDPRPIYDDKRNVRPDQDRWLEKGNYLRLSQLAIGYNIPKSVLKEYLNIRIYANLQNILTITSYKGLDPEFLNNDIFKRGVDDGAFPNPKGFTVGAQISF